MKEKYQLAYDLKASRIGEEETQKRLHIAKKREQELQNIIDALRANKKGGYDIVPLDAPGPAAEKVEAPPLNLSNSQKTEKGPAAAPIPEPTIQARQLARETTIVIERLHEDLISQKEDQEREAFVYTELSLIHI